VDAEVVRDVALSVSGLLVEKFGGPSVRPYQPDGYLAAHELSQARVLGQPGRRPLPAVLYTQWQRTFLHPSLLTFDAPSREECTVNRGNSNTPLQALVLLNDPIFVEAARVFAARILEDGGGTLDAELDWAYARALNRLPGRNERRILAELLPQGPGAFSRRRGGRRAADRRGGNAGARAGCAAPNSPP
jgi:hypothetical protein